MNNTFRLFVIFLLFSLTPIIGIEHHNVHNTSVSSEFNLQHKVARVSFFKTMVTASHIKQTGRTELGRFFVKNNTRDGFNVRLSSLNNGSMAPSGSSIDQNDGELPIAYNVNIVKDGEIGTGIETNFDHTSHDLSAEYVSILSTSGDSISSLTDAGFTLYVIIDDVNNALNMAGSYSDTVTITYEDL